MQQDWECGQGRPKPYGYKNNQCTINMFISGLLLISKIKTYIYQRTGHELIIAIDGYIFTVLSSSKSSGGFG